MLCVCIARVLEDDDKFENEKSSACVFVCLRWRSTKSSRRKLPALCLDGWATRRADVRARGARARG